MNFLNDMLPWAMPVITGLTGWLFGRRRQVAEADAAELDNVEKALGIYRNAIDDLARRQNELTSEMIMMRAENKKLREDLDKFAKNEQSLKRENKQLRERVSQLERELRIFKENKD